MNKLNKIFTTTMMLGISLVPYTTKALVKDEVVYSTINSNGSLYKTSVVTHLYGTENNTMEDTTLLKDILNINGKETFTINGENLNWNNKGKEIFYKGTIEKELPIKTEVKYYLDNKEMEEKDLKDKSGTVKIVINLENTDSHSVYVNGNYETLYTPFVVTLGTVMSNKNVSNISVTNGKIVNTGSKNFVVSMASPGLYDSLGVDEFKSMDNIVITYNTNSYKTNTLYLVATPKLIDTTDLDIFDKLDSVYNNVDALQTNMNTIEDGTNKIVSELENKINNMSSDGYKAIDDDTMNKLVSLAVSSASDEVSANEEVLKQQIEYTLNSSEQLNPSNIAYSALSTASGSADLANNILQYTNSCKNIDNFKKEILDKTASSDKILLGIAQVMGKIDSNTTVEYYEYITESVALSLIEGCDSYNTAYNVAEQELNGLKQMIPSTVYNAILDASKTTAASVSRSVASNVANKFTKETITSLNTLKDGLKTLQSGISTYNNDGIKVLSSYANSAKSVTNKLEKLVELTNDYKGFGSTDANTTTFVSVIK